MVETEEGNVHIIYDHNTYNLHFRVHAHFMGISQVVYRNSLVRNYKNSFKVKLFFYLKSYNIFDDQSSCENRSVVKYNRYINYPQRSSSPFLKVDRHVCICFLFRGIHRTNRKYHLVLQGKESSVDRSIVQVHRNWVMSVFCHVTVVII